MNQLDSSHAHLQTRHQRRKFLRHRNAYVDLNRFEAHTLVFHTSIGKSDAISKLIYMYLFINYH